MGRDERDGVVRITPTVFPEFPKAFLRGPDSPPNNPMAQWELGIKWGFCSTQRHATNQRHSWIRIQICWCLNSILEKEMATHSSVLAWKIPWTEGPGGLQSLGLQRVGHDWATSLSNSIYMLLCAQEKRPFFLTTLGNTHASSHSRVQSQKIVKLVAFEWLTWK